GSADWRCTGGGGRWRMVEGGGGRSFAHALQVLQGHPSCSPLPAPCSLIGRFDRLFDQSPRLPRRRLVNGCPRPAQCVFYLLARFEQVGAGLLARLAFETLSASLHLPLARRQLRGARLDLLRVPAQTLITRREPLLLRVELPLGFRHGPLGDLQHVTRDPETPRDGESVRPSRHAFEQSIGGRER